MSTKLFEKIQNYFAKFCLTENSAVIRSIKSVCYVMFLWYMNKKIFCKILEKLS